MSLKCAVPSLSLRCIFFFFCFFRSKKRRRNNKQMKTICCHIHRFKNSFSVCKSKLNLCCKLFCSNIQSICFWQKKATCQIFVMFFFHIACLLLCVLTPSHHYRKFACTIFFLLYSRNPIAGTLSLKPKVLKRLTPTTTKLLPSWLLIAYLLPSRRMLALQYNAPMNHPGRQNAVSCCSLPWLLSASSPMQPNAFRLSSLAQSSSTSGELQVSMS